MSHQCGVCYLRCGDVTSRQPNRVRLLWRQRCRRAENSEVAAFCCRLDRLPRILTARTVVEARVTLSLLVSFGSITICERIRRIAAAAEVFEATSLSVCLEVCSQSRHDSSRSVDDAAECDMFDPTVNSASHQLVLQHLSTTLKMSRRSDARRFRFCRIL